MSTESLNQDWKYANTWGLGFISQFEDFGDWLGRSQAGGSWSAPTQAGCSHPRLAYTHTGQYGALIYPRNPAVLVNRWKQWVHTFVSDHNLEAGRGSCLGPACLLKDTGAGHAPDGYYCCTLYNGSPRIRITAVDAGGGTFTTVLEEPCEVLGGSMLTLYLQAEMTVPESHTLAVYVNGVYKFQVTVDPGVHDGAESTLPGIGATGLVTYTWGTHYVGQWGINRV